MTVVENAEANSKNIIFTIKDTKVYVLLDTLSAKDNQKPSKLLSKGFERSAFWKKYKTKYENKSKTNEYKYFVESKFFEVNRLFALVYLNRDNYVKRFKAQRYYLPKGIIKNYKVIINGKSFYDQPIDSSIKRKKYEN